MTYTQEIAREAIAKFKEATELCSKLQKDNAELHQMLEDVFHHMKRIRELERECLLTPVLN